MIRERANRKMAEMVSFVNIFVPKIDSSRMQLRGKVIYCWSKQRIIVQYWTSAVYREHMAVIYQQHFHDLKHLCNAACSQATEFFPLKFLCRSSCSPFRFWGPKKWAVMKTRVARAFPLILREKIPLSKIWVTLQNAWSGIFAACTLDQSTKFVQECIIPACVILFNGSHNI